MRPDENAKSWRSVMMDEEGSKSVTIESTGFVFSWDGLSHNGPNIANWRCRSLQVLQCQSVNSCQHCSVTHCRYNVARQTTWWLPLVRRSYNTVGYNSIPSAPHLLLTDVIRIWQRTTSAMATLSPSAYKFIILLFNCIINAYTSRE